MCNEPIQLIRVGNTILLKWIKEVNLASRFSGSTQLSMKKILYFSSFYILCAIEISCSVQLSMKQVL